jgi:thioesterase domain-containing protein/acyl carrier protein
MFQDLLGVDEIGIDDSFFDLGGHSLIAVRLFAQIKKTYGSDFPISLLFEAPTIRKIAAQIPENSASTVDMTEQQGSISQLPDQSAPKFTHIVAMHPETPGPATPFFLVAGMFGNVLNLRHLGTILGNERPFYGLQARGLFGDQPPHTTIEDAARDYIREMREVQPNGPYMLGGFSGGGIIAYEIAQQLRNAGENVAALIMLDTPLPQRRPLTLRDRMAIQAHELKQKGPAYVVQWATRRLRWELDKYRKNDDSAADTTAQFHNSAIEAAFLNASSQYQVAPWAGPLTLFRPPLQGRWQVAPDRLIDHERAYVLHDNDWGQWAAALTIIEVPGDHDSMVLEPNVRVLASRLREILAAQEQTQHTISPSNQPQQKAAE